MPTHEIRQDILTPRVECPDDLAPRDWVLLRFALDMLSKEEQEATRIVVNGSSMFFNDTNTFDDICQTELFSTGEKWNLFTGQELLEIARDFFSNRGGLSVVRKVSVR
jgi:hypothetical protein